MKPALFRAEAEAEFKEASSWYEARRPQLGQDFRSAVETAVRRICETPERWTPAGEDTRRIVVRRFPYSVVYTILPVHILIIAVAHHKRSHRYWKNRL